MSLKKIAAEFSDHQHVTQKQHDKVKGYLAEK